MARLAAFIVLLIPGVIAAGGIKFMRDAIYGVVFSAAVPGWVQFVLGLLMFALGLGFFAGFLLHRDRKKGRVQARFMKQEKP